MLLACAKLGFLPQRLLAAPGLAGLLAAGTPQALANAASACGQLRQRNEQLVAALLAKVQQRLTATGTSMYGQHSTQGLAAAVESWQVHTWLLDFQLAGGQGLQGSLTEQQPLALSVCSSAAAVNCLAAADAAADCGQGWWDP
jgi:hypothetical protein